MKERTSEIGSEANRTDKLVNSEVIVRYTERGMESVGRLSDIVHLDGLTEDEEVSEHHEIYSTEWNHRWNEGMNEVLANSVIMSEYSEHYPR